MTKLHVSGAGEHDISNNTIIGYDVAGRTVHPPPPPNKKRSRGGGGPLLEKIYILSKNKAQSQLLLSLQNSGFRNTYECMITVGIVFAVNSTMEIKGLSFVQTL